MHGGLWGGPEDAEGEVECGGVVVKGCVGAVMSEGLESARQGPVEGKGGEEEKPPPLLGPRGGWER